MQTKKLFRGRFFLVTKNIYFVDTRDSELMCVLVGTLNPYNVGLVSYITYRHIGVYAPVSTVLHKRVNEKNEIQWSYTYTPDMWRTF